VTEGILLEIILVVIGGYSQGEFFHTPMASYLGIEQIPAWFTFTDFAAVFIIIQSAMCLFSNFWMSISTTTKTYFRLVTSLLPVIYFILAFYLLKTTQFYQDHVSYALWMLVPIFSLVNSKLVVCNVSHMEFNPIQPIILPWLLLLVDIGLPEWQVLALIMASNSMMYVYFVVTTID
jgi:hypothetical protein